MRTTEHKRQQNERLFDDMLRNPSDLVAGVTLPANAKLFASCDVAVVGDAPVVSIAGVDYHVLDCAAGEARAIKYAERYAIVKKALGAPGTVTLYIEGPFGRPLKIAEG